MVLGLGSWTVWEKWYYIHLIDDAAYKVTPGSPLHVIIVVVEHEPAGPADWAGGRGDWSPGLHRRPLPQQAPPGNGQSDLKYHHDFKTITHIAVHDTHPHCLHVRGGVGSHLLRPAGQTAGGSRRLSEDFLL